MATLNANTYPSLESAAKHFLSEINKKAEAARAKLTTEGVSQARIYEVKVKEAQEGGGPLLEAEADALGVTLKKVQQSVLDAYQKWLSACGSIEAKRLRAKALVRSASSPSEMHNILKQLTFD